VIVTTWCMETRFDCQRCDFSLVERDSCQSHWCADRAWSLGSSPRLVFGGRMLCCTMQDVMATTRDRVLFVIVFNSETGRMRHQTGARAGTRRGTNSDVMGSDGRCLSTITSDRSDNAVDSDTSSIHCRGLDVFPPSRPSRPRLFTLSSSGRRSDDRRPDERERPSCRCHCTRYHYSPLPNLRFSSHFPTANTSIQRRPWTTATSAMSSTLPAGQTDKNRLAPGTPSPCCLLTSLDQLISPPHISR
jgi:hypothetical protein